MRITRKWLREKRACYSDEDIDELAAGREHITVTELLELPICYDDKIWVMFRLLTEEQLKELAQSCADAVKVALVASYAGFCAESTHIEDIFYFAKLAAETAICFDSKEEQRQINRLKEALNV